jgi:HAD superfamily hydrolase (TIGR01509 family)
MADPGVLFDVDGTLVDSNYLHVVAWWQAFRAYGHDVAMTDIHRHVGQGANRLVASLLDREDEEVVQAHTDFYGQWMHRARAFPGAADLLRAVDSHGLRVVLATSASELEAKHLQRALDADDVVAALTNKDDVDASKPEPDIVEAALKKGNVDGERAIFVGDTVWDVEAAKRAGLDCIGVLSGGISEPELRDAGAVAVYQGVADLLEKLSDSPIGRFADVRP